MWRLREFLGIRIEEYIRQIALKKAKDLTQNYVISLYGSSDYWFSGGFYVNIYHPVLFNGHLLMKQWKWNKSEIDLKNFSHLYYTLVFLFMMI